MGKSVKEFIADYTGKSVDVEPGWGLTGECVSLIQRYVIECFGFKAVARGDAKYYGKGLVNRNEAYQVDTPRYGDIVVFDDGSEYGHVAIWLGANKIFDQSNYTRKTAQIRGYIDANKITYYRVKGTLKPDSVKPKETTKVVTKDVIYTVQSGDTLSGIAEEYGINWRDLYSRNKKVIGSDPDLIYPGQKLIIKTVTEKVTVKTYTVQKGDTLSDIGDKLGVNWKDIYNKNKDIIKDPNLIYPGQVLKI